MSIIKHFKVYRYSIVSSPVRLLKLRLFSSNLNKIFYGYFLNASTCALHTLHRADSTSNRHLEF